ncbi:MAG: hypothetical protein U9N87_01095 [Planctomycetota bacterium]|nr:hypothetical protein [Planctomycetota bacterium]
MKTLKAENRSTETALSRDLSRLLVSSDNSGPLPSTTATRPCSVIDSIDPRPDESLFDTESLGIASIVGAKLVDDVGDFLLICS